MSGRKSLENVKPLKQDGSQAGSHKISIGTKPPKMPARRGKSKWLRFEDMDGYFVNDIRVKSEDIAAGVKYVHVHVEGRDALLAATYGFITNGALPNSSADIRLTEDGRFISRQIPNLVTFKERYLTTVERLKNKLDLAEAMTLPYYSVMDRFSLDQLKQFTAMTTVDLFNGNADPHHGNYASAGESKKFSPADKLFLFDFDVTGCQAPLNQRTLNTPIYYQPKSYGHRVTKKRMHSRKHNAEDTMGPHYYPGSIEFNNTTKLTKKSTKDFSDAVKDKIRKHYKELQHVKYLTFVSLICQPHEWLDNNRDHAIGDDPESFTQRHIQKHKNRQLEVLDGLLRSPEFVHDLLENHGDFMKHIVETCQQYNQRHRGRDGKVKAHRAHLVMDENLCLVQLHHIYEQAEAANMINKAYRQDVLEQLLPCEGMYSSWWKSHRAKLPTDVATAKKSSALFPAKAAKILDAAFKGPDVESAVKLALKPVNEGYKPEKRKKPVQKAYLAIKTLTCSADIAPAILFDIRRPTAPHLAAYGDFTEIPYKTVDIFRTAMRSGENAAGVACGAGTAAEVAPTTPHSSSVTASPEPAGV